MGDFALSLEKQEVIEFLHYQVNLCVLCACGDGYFFVFLNRLKAAIAV